MDYMVSETGYTLTGEFVSKAIRRHAGRAPVLQEGLSWVQLPPPSRRWVGGSGITESVAGFVMAIVWVWTFGKAGKWAWSTTQSTGPK